MRVVLVESHTLVRRGIRHLLEDGGVQVLADGEPGPSSMEVLGRDLPDVLLLEVDMGGQQFLERVKKRHPSLPVLVVSAQLSQSWIAGALAAGAEGYLSKSCSPEDLLEALKAVVAGGRPLGPEVVTALADGWSHPAPRLTAREREVLSLVGCGCAAPELARRLSVSVNTAKTHLHSLYRKLGVSDRAQLLLLAQRSNLTDPSVAYGLPRWNR